MHESISVVLPVFNERENIAACLRGLWSALRGTQHEILVCYDLDEDDTLPAIAAMPDAPPSVRLVKNTIGRGAANAIRAGFAAARGDVVVTSMADLSDPPEVILAMAQKIRAGADVVAGSRYMRGGSQSGGPWLKRTLSRLAGVSLHWIAGVGTRDATSNFRGYSRRFLDTVTVESRTGFEIALELTVKAHLHGHVVAEVPSSWVDRSAGQSRFRMWKWMPNYLRWYVRAAAAPVLAWGLLAALAAIGLWNAPPPVWGAGAVRLRLSALAVLAVGTLAIARRARGRTALADAAHPLVFVLPRLLGASWEIALTGGSLASALVLLGTCGWKKTLVGLRDSFRPSASSPVPSTWVVALLFLLVWTVHRFMPVTIPTTGLDSSWQAAMARVGQAGRDYVFTYGPLGFLHTTMYETGWFWPKLLLWEGAFKLVLAAIFVAVAARIRTARDLWLLFLLLLVHPARPDPLMNLAIVAVAVWAIASGPSDPRDFARALLALAIFAILPIVKFSFAVPAVAATVAIVASRWSSRGHALALAIAYPVLVAVVWVSAGQDLQNLPAYVVGSAEVAAGYSEGMSSPGLPGLRALALVIAALLALQAAILAISGRTAGRALACAFLVSLWVSYKLGFVRAADHARSFFDFASIAPFLLAAFGGPLAGVGGPRVAVGGPPGRLGAVATGARLASAGLALVGLAVSTDAGWRLPVELVPNAVERIERALDVSLEPRWFQQRCETRLANAREAAALPRVRAEVGTASIDFVSYQQGVLFLNDLNWRNRPVFQGYTTFTPELMERNARFFESERASAYVLFHLESISEHMPTMDDALALHVLLRDYRPVLTEKAYLLLRREPRPTQAAPVAVMQKEIAFGERVDLRGAPGACHLLRLDLRYSAAGRIRVLLDCAPPIFAELELDSGRTVTTRLVPGMIRAGAIVDPFLSNQSEWIAWHSGEQTPRPVALRLVEPASPWMYRDRVGFEFLTADELVPQPVPGLLQRFLFSPFETQPVASSASSNLTVDEVGDVSVLVAPPPSELVFDVGAGHHVLTGRFGFLADAATGSGSDGATFRALVRDANGEDRVVFEKFLDPARVPADRRLQALKAPFSLDAPARVRLVTDPGPSGDARGDSTCWTEIRIE